MSTETTPDPLFEWFRRMGIGMGEVDYEAGIEAIAAHDRAVKAEALRGAVDEFESSVGPVEFANQTNRDGLPWVDVHEAWEQQGAYMDWLRARADELKGGHR